MELLSNRIAPAITRKDPSLKDFIESIKEFVEECETNLQRLLVDYFSNLVVPEYFEKMDKEEKKSFDYFDNLLIKS